MTHPEKHNMFCHDMSKNKMEKIHSVASYTTETIS